MAVDKPVPNRFMNRLRTGSEPVPEPVFQNYVFKPPTLENLSVGKIFGFL
jgi:hypothetical protein